MKTGYKERIIASKRTRGRAVKKPLTEKQVSKIIREVREERRRKSGSPEHWVVVSVRSKERISLPPRLASSK